MKDSVVTKYRNILCDFERRVFEKFLSKKIKLDRVRKKYIFEPNE